MAAAAAWRHGGGGMAAPEGAAAGGARRRRGRHCPDCGAVLVYYPHLSTPRALEDDRRMLAYSCPDCTDDFERPRMLAVRREGRGGGGGGGSGGGGNEGIESVHIEIIERGGDAA